MTEVQTSGGQQVTPGSLSEALSSVTQPNTRLRDEKRLSKAEQRILQALGASSGTDSGDSMADQLVKN